MINMKAASARLRAKLNNTAGETITEVLVGLIIAALALTMLAAMITSSTRLLQNSESFFQGYVSEENNLAVQSGSVSAGSGTVKVSNGTNDVKLTDGSGSTIEVLYFVNDSKSTQPVVSYRAKKAGE